MVELVSLGVQICRLADLSANLRILVFGAGSIGLLAQAVAKASGARTVVAVDIGAARFASAKEFATDGTLLLLGPEEDADTILYSEEIGGMIKGEFQLGEGTDVVLKGTGAEPCIQAGVNVAKKGGNEYSCRHGERVLFPITTASIRGLTIKGSIGYLTDCYPNAIHLVASGKPNVKKADYQSIHVWRGGEGV